MGTKSPKLKIEGNKTFSIKWFNPRDGGEFQNGSELEIEGNGFKTLGDPPSEVDKDWVVVVN